MDEDSRGLTADEPWMARDLAPDSWVVSLDDGVRAELRAVAHAVAEGRSVDIAREAPRYAALAHELTDLLESGRGFAVLRGLPLEGPSAAMMPDEKLAEFLLRISTPLGTPVVQTRDGSKVSFIRDLGRDASLPTVRGHQTAAELPFHCDRADVIGLLCVRPAAVGGHSLLASAIAVRDILARERPDLLQVLERPLPQDRRGEEAPGESPWIMLPVFAEEEGRFVARYIRRFIESAARFPDAPRLTAEQREALDAVDEILARPGVALHLDFQPGDLQFLNNNTVWHARTAFRDAAVQDTPLGRLLLRVWLAPRNSRALPPCFAPLYGATEAGAVRGGVWSASATALRRMDSA